MHIHSNLEFYNKFSLANVLITSQLIPKSFDIDNDLTASFCFGTVITIAEYKSKFFNFASIEWFGGEVNSLTIKV